MLNISIIYFILILVISLFNSQEPERSITYNERTCTGESVNSPIEGTFDVRLELLPFSAKDLHLLKISTTGFYNNSEIIVDTTYNGKNINIDICGYLPNKSGASFFWRGPARCSFLLNNNFDSLYVTIKHKAEIDTFIVNYTKTKYTIKKISHSNVFNNDFGKEIILRKNP